MPDDKQSLDLIGLGKAMEAIPDESWNKLVSTATETFEKTIAPITELTSGLGRWIRQKFDNKVEVEKVLLAEGLARAVEKLSTANSALDPNVNIQVCGEIVDKVSTSNEDLVRELWINLLARELGPNNVHPEFVNVLSRMSAQDAKVLVEVAEKSANASINLAMRRAFNRAVPQATGVWQFAFRSEFNLSIEVLQTLKLVRVESGQKLLTEFGKHFLTAVSEPESQTAE